MKRMLVIHSMLLWAFNINAQDSSAITIERLKELSEPLVSAFVEGSKYKSVADVILNDPGLYNKLWGHVYNHIREKDQRNLTKNLQIQFKTFESNDSNVLSLGFSYNWDIDLQGQKETSYQRNGFTVKLNTSGNVAFKKELNPLDFQQARLVFGHYGFLGGIVNVLEPDMVKRLNEIKLKLASIEDEDELKNSPLWNELTQAMGIKNHYYYDFTINGGWEGTQDFTTNDINYGAQLRFSAKSYSDNNVLARSNILDYPFALIRYLSKTDGSVTPYGAALPVITVGIDLVKPIDDKERKVLTGNEKQFTRFRFEAGFRTLVAIAFNNTIHFNAAYRLFKELNAPSIVKTAGLNQFSYFTFSVTGADTYFFSYSYGKLPFDRTNNAVYELGFKLNL
jgi:hypothetical protein